MFAISAFLHCPTASFLTVQRTYEFSYPHYAVHPAAPASVLCLPYQPQGGDVSGTSVSIAASRGVKVRRLVGGTMRLHLSPPHPSSGAPVELGAAYGGRLDLCTGEKQGPQRSTARSRRGR